MHGMVQPFETKYKNYQEIVLFLNFQGLYVVSLYGQGSTSTTAVKSNNYHGCCSLHLHHHISHDHLRV